MTIATHDLGNEPIDTDLQMLLVGSEKSGKSLLAATAPEPVLFIDTDKRAGALKGRAGVYALTYSDPPSTLMQPTAFNEVLDTIGKLEKSLTLRDIGFQSAPDGLQIRTVVFDSVTTLSNMARRYVLYANPKDLAYVISVGQNQYRVPRNWHGWGSEMEMVENAIVRALGIKGLNVIVTLHETKEEAEDSTEDAPKYTGGITVFPVRYRILVKYFNEVWRLERVKEGPPTVQINPSGTFSKASSALMMGLGNTIQPNIKQVLEQAKTRRK